MSARPTAPAPVITMPRQQFASCQNSEMKSLVPKDKGSNTSHLWFSQSPFTPSLTHPHHGPVV